MRIIYTDAYLVDIGSHVFPTEKYGMVRDLLLKNDGFKEENFIQPTLAKDEDILLVHAKSYLDKFKAGRLSIQEQLRLELPHSKELVRASLLCAGGSIMAAKLALKNAIGIHLGGGFHHAFPDHGEGFCVFNDIAIAIRRLKKDGLIKRAMVIDCDLHQGNGTAYIFQDDKDVFTFSIHQENNYPSPKPPSSLDIGLEDGAGDTRYLEELNKNIPERIKDFKPDLIIYVAGADPYKEDQIGNLSLSIDGLKKRDEFVFEAGTKFHVPVCVVLAGGYAVKKEDTATIHYNTIKTGLRYEQ
ncbi:MAG: histone deacetylase [Candidatus Omnitrophica bacterium]|nr:histone deacetylase [Candidatus Omnitrophota bacterium]